MLCLYTSANPAEAAGIECRSPVDPGVGKIDEPAAARLPLVGRENKGLANGEARMQIQAAVVFVFLQQRQALFNRGQAPIAVAAEVIPIQLVDPPGNGAD